MSLSAEESYNKHFTTFTAIPADAVLTPKMSRDDTIGEAEELNIVAQEDKDALEGAGLNPEFIATLDERIGAYAHASSLYETSIFTKSDARRKWDEIEQDAYDFKWDLLHSLRFACRKEPKQMKIISEISAGRGRRDLVLDLKDISVFGEKNREALEKINFDFTQLAKASTMHDDLSNLLAEANTSPEEISKLKDEAYQAFTWLNEAVSEIREYGQFRFWKDEDKLNRYKSDFYQQVGKIRKKEEEPVAESQDLN